MNYQVMNLKVYTETILWFAEPWETLTAQGTSVIAYGNPRLNEIAKTR